MFKKVIWTGLLLAFFAVWQFSGCSKKSNEGNSKTAGTSSKQTAGAAKTSANSQTPLNKMKTNPGTEKSVNNAAPENILSANIKQYMKKLQIQAPIKSVEAMDFTGVNLNGETVKLSDYRGKVVFLNFWATWCPWCVKEMPSMQTLLEKMQKTNGKNFVILAVDAGESKSQVVKWLKDKNLKFDFVLDPKSQINGMYGVRGLPSTYIVRKNGRILGRAVGARDWATEASYKLFEALLKE